MQFAKIIRIGIDKITKLFSKNKNYKVSQNNFSSDVIVENISDDYYQQFLETKEEFADIDFDISYTYNSDIEKNGWRTPGQENPHWWCGMWRADGCDDVKTHERLGYGKKTYVHQYKRSCFRAGCKKCMHRWATRQSLVAAQRTQIYEKHRRGGKLQYLTIALPLNYDYSDIKKVRGDAIQILKDKGVSGGSIVFCPFELDPKTRMWIDRPLFVVAYYGKTIESGFVDGWDISKIISTKSTEAIFYTILRMSGVKKGTKSFVWFGSLSYSKLKLKKPAKKVHVCPACNAKLFELARQRYNFKPDSWKSGFYDPDEWRLYYPGNRLVYSLLSKFHTSRKLIHDMIIVK